MLLHCLPLSFYPAWYWLSPSYHPTGFWELSCFDAVILAALELLSFFRTFAGYFLLFLLSFFLLTFAGYFEKTDKGFRKLFCSFYVDLLAALDIVWTFVGCSIRLLLDFGSGLVVFISVYWLPWSFCPIDFRGLSIKTAVSLTSYWLLVAILWDDISLMKDLSQTCLPHTFFL